MREYFFSFTGRFGRLEYILRSIVLGISCIGLLLALGVVFFLLSKGKPGDLESLLIIAVLLLFFLGMTANVVRRWHDLNYSTATGIIIGIMDAAVFIAEIGNSPDVSMILSVLVFIPNCLLLFKKGTVGDNQYGPDPLQVATDEKPQKFAGVNPSLLASNEKEVLADDKTRYIPKEEVVPFSKEEQYLKLFKICCDKRSFSDFQEACADNVKFIDGTTDHELVARSKKDAISILEKITRGIEEETKAYICTWIGKVIKYNGFGADKCDLVGKSVIMLGTSKNMKSPEIIFFEMDRNNKVAKIFNTVSNMYTVAAKEERHYAPDEYVYLNLIKAAIDSEDSSRLFNYLAEDAKFTNLKGDSREGCYSIAYLLRTLRKVEDIEYFERDTGIDNEVKTLFDLQVFLVEVKGYKNKINPDIPRGKRGLAFSLTGFDKYRAVMFIEIGTDGKISFINLTKNEYVLEELVPMAEICKHKYKDNTEVIANNIRIAAQINEIKSSGSAREIIKQHILKNESDPVYALMFYVNNFYCYKEKVSPDIERIMEIPLQELNSDNSLTYVSIVYYAYLFSYADSKSYDDRVMEAIHKSRMEFTGILCCDVLRIVNDQDKYIYFVTAELTYDDLESDLAKVLTKYVVCAGAPDLDFAQMYKLVYMYLSSWIKEYMQQAYREVDNIQKFYLDCDKEDTAVTPNKEKTDDSLKKEDNISTDTVQQQEFTLGDLRKLKQLLDDGIITQEDFDAAKKKILGL